MGRFSRFLITKIAKLTTDNRLISDSTIYVSIIYIQINLHGIKIIPYICEINF